MQFSNPYYRLCNIGVLLDMAATYANIDPSFIVESLTRQIFASYTTAPALLEQISYLTTVDPSNPDATDYYKAGSAAGQLFKVLFDFTIDN